MSMPLMAFHELRRVLAGGKLAMARGYILAPKDKRIVTKGLEVGKGAHDITSPSEDEVAKRR